MKKHPKHSESGFTIVELMVATAILSIIILLVTIMMLNIGNLYYKGVNQARIQDDVRSISDQVSQDLKYNNSFDHGSAVVHPVGPAVNLYSYCVGGTVRYSFVLGYKIGSGRDADGITPQFTDVLIRDDNKYAYYTGESANTNSSCQPVNLTDTNFDINNDSGALELVSPNSRLTSFCIGAISGGSCTPASASPYLLSIGVAYGDIDLLSNFTINQLNPSASCKGTTGEQFCSTAQLNTLVVQRL